MCSAILVIAIGLAQSNVFPSAEDTKELVEIRRIQRLYGSKVWPDFRDSRIPIILYDDRFEYLISHPSAPEDWTAIASLAGETLHRRPAKNPQGFAARVGKIWCGSFATFSHMSKSLKLGRGFHIAAILHEMFHAFQAQAAPERFASAMKVYSIEDSYPESNSVLMKDWTREGAILAGAVKASSQRETLSRISQFLHFRAKRRERANFDARLVEFEMQLEWLEGLGKYAEVRIIELAAADAKSPPLYDLSPAIKLHASEILQLSGGLGIAKGDGRYYQSGLAQAMLLDRINPKWKDEPLGAVFLEKLLGSAETFSCPN